MSLAVGRVTREMLRKRDEHPVARTRPTVFDDRKRIIEITEVGVHSAKPEREQMCLNDLIFGMPRPEPWDWYSSAAITPNWISAWAGGERCVAVWECGPLTVRDGWFHVVWSPGNPYEFEAVVPW